jgi:hypothetical protein
MLTGMIPTTTTRASYDFAGLMSLMTGGPRGLDAVSLRARIGDFLDAGYPPSEAQGRVLSHVT